MIDATFNNKIKKPLISVITVVYNGSKTCEKTIKSVINQTYDNVEYIIIDGGSTDGTLDIIEKYEDKIDYWISEKDSGIYDAMNKGIKVANGDWIYFLGADDILFDVLDDLFKELDIEKNAVYGDAYVPKQHKLYNGKFTKFKLFFNNICHQAIFYNKKVFQNRQFDLKYKFLSDYAFNISIFDEKKFKYVPIMIANYNDIDGRSSRIYDLNFKSDKLSLIKHFGKFYFLMFYAYKKLILLLHVLRLKSIVRKVLLKK
jgi:glycosyltransferase involved in cell wall biosynthesis